MRTRPTALLLSALALVAGCTSAGPSTPSSTSAPGVQSSSAAAGPLAAFYDQKLQWTACDSGFECTKLTVPLDYAAPEGKTIQLAMVRLRSKQAHGSLVLNPGGPGESGIDLARHAYDELSADLVVAFDIVGFDPRGVGASDPVDCLSDTELDKFLATDGTPRTPQQVAAITTVSAGFGAGCVAKTPDIAAHMGTVDAARDMDVIRAALGEEKLDYLGFSYGTDLGAEYADLFPARVGRMVLDGVFPGSLTLEQGLAQQSDSYDASLRRFAADCVTRADCPLTGTPADGVRQIQRFLTGLDTHPLPAGPNRLLTEGNATPSLYYLLYNPKDSWPYLRTSLAAAFAGDGTDLIAALDGTYGRQTDGTYSGNFLEAYYAVTCTDTPQLGGPKHVAALGVAWSRTAPVFGEGQAWGTLPCWHWAPVQTTTASLPVAHATGSAPILLVSTTHDPATPYAWGVEVAKELDNATLLTYDGDGHTAYHRGSDCIDAAVDAYLIHGTVPPKGTGCHAGP
jgi:pimeloyl-ACP methyl ester carboxylesterase